ncbi:sugar porter family MFS transporter [Ameyamaea chiangmaiensis]|uniref:Sugar porter family MFS transporter n=1 Tax=Ameyamaea chiangmaiensis TaxID=442969 RepID=A0A850PHV4_9PROT|nr:sugar porter family MFS transporter [Ameyamaea chiangmaiensis]MBS4074905.1 sugar porter family MFS transporter [Ameyamaea chiangmaiensis]NVN40781.1 sugar porter family MFS transporter [Ameyamaea chiangmaiensis]
MTDTGHDAVHEGHARAFAMALLAALAGLMFGLDTGVIAGALHFIADTFEASSRTQEWIVSSMMAGAALGSVAAGGISYRYGRSGAMVGAAVMFLIGTLTCALAPGIAVMIVGRVMLGLAVGVAAFAAPLYISEITVGERRGSMISFYQLMVTLGIFLAFVSDSLLAPGAHWRWMLGVMAVPSSVFLIGALFLPHTPRWLMMRGQTGAARRVMLSLRGDARIADAEIREISVQLHNESGSGFALFRRSANFRRSVALGIVLQIFQQLTGINVLMYYAPRVFEAAHFGVSAAVWATTLVGLVNMGATGIAIVLVDRWGRRPLLMASCAIAAFAMVSVGILLALGAGSVLQQAVLVGMVLLFVAGFAMGEGPLVWTLCSEIQPLQGRDFGIACSTFTNWAANWAVSNTFLSLLAGIGESATFWLFGILNAVFIIVTFLFVPETKDVSLEKIEDNLMHGAPLRRLGR